MKEVICPICNKKRLTKLYWQSAHSKVPFRCFDCSRKHGNYISTFPKGHIPHNAGTAKPKEYWINLSKERRKDENYKDKELRDNALRAKEKGYHNEPERRKEIKILLKERIKRCGVFKPREWNAEEIQYLKDNYKILLWEDIAKNLQRSYISVNRKCNRLKLKKHKRYETI